MNNFFLLELLGLEVHVIGRVQFQVTVGEILLLDACVCILKLIIDQLTPV